MRKLFLILILFVSFSGFSQPIVNRAGQANTVQDSRLAAQYNFFTPRFSDTTSANIQKGVDSCGALIFTYDYNGFWYRQCSPKKWVQLFANSASPSSDTLVWKLSGNAVSTRGIAPFLGTTSPDNLNIGTGNSVRLVIPSSGITRNMAAVNKYLLFDTITKAMYYGDGGSGGSVSANNGLVVNSGGAIGLDSNGVNPLSRSTIINTNDNFFSFTNASNFSIAYPGGNAAFNTFGDEVSIGDKDAVSLITAGSASGLILNNTSGQYRVVDIPTAGVDTSAHSIVMVGIGIGNDDALYRPTSWANLKSALGVNLGLQNVITNDPVLTSSNTIDGGGNTLVFDNNVEVDINANKTSSSTNLIQLQTNITGSRFSRIKISGDSLIFNPGLGNFYVDTLNSSANAADSMMVWNKSNGSVGIRAIPSGGSSSLTVGTTTITSGTNTRVLYNNSGVLGEYAVTGSGTTAVLSTAPTFTTSITTPITYGSSTANGTLTLAGNSAAASNTGTNQNTLFKAGNSAGTLVMATYNAGNVAIGATPSVNANTALTVQSLTNNQGEGLRVYALNNTVYTELGWGKMSYAGRFVYASGSHAFTYNSGSGIYLGADAAATAQLHIAAATASPNTGQIKFESSTLPTTPETGLMNMRNGLWYLDSSNSVRDTIATRRWARNNISGSSGAFWALTGTSTLTGTTTIDANTNTLSIGSGGAYFKTSGNDVTLGDVNANINSAVFNVNGSSAASYFDDASHASAVGINTNSPTQALHVVGSIRMVDGNEGAGKILVSDANGVGSWQNNSSAVSYSRLVKVLNVNITDAGNVGTGEDDLMSFTVPADTLSTNGDFIDFEMSFSLAANANNKTVKLYWAGVQIYTTGTQAQNSGSLVVKGKIYRTGAATQKIVLSQVNNTSLFVDETTYTTGAATLSASNILKATGEATSDNDIIQRTLNVVFNPNH